MPLRPIYYDTETTGVRADRDRIIEIAAFDPVRNKTFVHLVNPGVSIPPEATAVHKITDAMVEDAPSFATVASALVEFCSDQVVLIAHNNDSFDKLFLEHEFRRAGIALPPWPYIDTLKWARRYRNDLPRHTLQSLREVYGIPPNQAHRALDDVVVLYEIFSQMIDDLPMETVAELLNQPMGPVTRMPFGKHQGKPLSDVPREYVRWLRDQGALDKPENAELRTAFQALSV